MSDQELKPDKWVRDCRVKQFFQENIKSRYSYRNDCPYRERYLMRIIIVKPNENNVLRSEWHECILVLYLWQAYRDVDLETQQWQV